jgi:hypothetical protein
MKNMLVHFKFTTIPLRGTEGAFPPLFRVDQRGASGYTLLEIAIALALLFQTLAPISVMIHRNNSLIRAQQELTAMCLLEQEVARAKCRSLNILPVQRHVIDNCEWTITSTISGDKLKKVTMVVCKNNMERGRTIFYANIEK